MTQPVHVGFLTFSILLSFAGMMAVPDTGKLGAAEAGAAEAGAAKAGPALVETDKSTWEITIRGEVIVGPDGVTLKSMIESWAFAKVPTEEIVKRIEAFNAAGKLNGTLKIGGVGLKSTSGSADVAEQSSEKTSSPNESTGEEKKAGFELLFNGRDLHGWEPQNGPWKVEDGAIYFPSADSSQGPFFLAYHAKPIPADFELRFEWKEAPPGSPFLEGQFAFGTCLGHTTANDWTGSLRCSYCAGDRHIALVTDEITVPAKWTGFSSSLAPGKDARRPAGQWNDSRIVCKGSQFQHWLNGQRILEVDLRHGHWMKEQESGSPILVEWLKVKNRGFRLSLNTIGGAAWYRSLKVRAIAEDERVGGENGHREAEHVALPSSPVVVAAQRTETPREAVFAILKLGAHVDFTNGAEPSGPTHKLLGDEFFTMVSSVNFVGTQATDADMRHLKGLSQLKQLWLQQTEVTDAGLQPLKEVNALTMLHLDGTRITDAGLQHLKGLRQLQFLYLDGCQITDAGLRHLGDMKQLKFLVLSGTRVTDAGLSQLKELTQLQHLSLARTKITDTGLQHIAGLTQLEELWLEETSVTDVGLQRLKGFKRLSALNISGTKVTDAGLQHLKQLNALHFLWHQETAVSPEGLKELRGSLPDLN